MQTKSCPLCGEPLPESASYCAGCGEAAPSSETTLRLQRTHFDGTASETRAARSNSLEDSEMLSLEPGESDATIRLFRKKMAWVVDEDLEKLNALVEEESDDEVSEQHSTWQKVVEHKTPPTLPVVALSGSRLKRKHRYPFFPHRQFEPGLFFWLSLSVLLILLLGGAFGVALSFGREARPSVSARPTLQIAPTTSMLGGIVTLHGTHFTTEGRLTLSRDQRLPLLDTNGVSSIQADAHGAFSDTVIIDPAWLAGLHRLYVTDMHTGQQAQFPLLVIGRNVLQGPPHLLLSSGSLDFGSGDEATNASRLLALSNAGGGQLLWQADSGQPWLQISPQSGVIPSGGHLSAIVAVNRARLTPGAYSANVVFMSNTEQVMFAVNMQVIPLQPAHQAVLQLSSAALTFNATASGPNPQSQVITVSNPGIQQLLWGATITLQNGNNWLWVSSSSGKVSPGGQQAVAIGINSQNLTPGVYKGTLLFANQGPQSIQGSPQSIFISLTVAPLCTLALTPGSLRFSGVHGQASPVAQVLHIGVAPGCTTSQHWDVSSATIAGGNWLSVNQSRGSTPAQLQVSVNSASLAPGNYAGTLTFVAQAGSQIVPVMLTINPIACGITAPTTLTLQGTAGQANPVSQNAVLNSSGDCAHTLRWTSTTSVTTPGVASWLSAASTGLLTPPASASVSVEANLAGMSANTYSGIVTITVMDNTTNQMIGTVQIAVTLMVLAQCVLQTPSSSDLPFSASVGSNPAVSSGSFTVGVTGTCAGNVTITASGDAGSSGWLTVTSPVTLASGETTTITVTITSSALAAGSYSGTVVLTATDGNGPISGSSQTVSVQLTIQ